MRICSTVCVCAVHIVVGRDSGSLDPVLVGPNLITPTSRVPAVPAAAREQQQQQQDLSQPLIPVDSLGTAEAALDRKIQVSVLKRTCIGRHAHVLTYSHTYPYTNTRECHSRKFCTYKNAQKCHHAYSNLLLDLYIAMALS